jgi:cyclopropane fatty-acyl-phospholipid synthase-like methyltransferase
MDDLQYSPAAERNKRPITAVLASVLPSRGTVLEIASGTGQHVVHFAASFPHLHWQPSDPDPELRRSIRSRAAAAGLDNIAEPLALDVRDSEWPIAAADAVLTINLLHIAPWAVTETLFRGAAAILDSGAPLLIYGPFNRDGAFTSEGNRAFDLQLRRADADWGIRDIESVIAAAKAAGFVLQDIDEMPANNLIVRFQRGVDFAGETF